MAATECFIKGHFVKFYPKLLKDAIDNLTPYQKLIVVLTFIQNSNNGEPIPEYQIPRIFTGIPSFQEDISALVSYQVLSKDNDGGLFLPFALDEYTATKDHIEKKRNAGRKGGLKASRNKVASGLQAKVNKDKDKDKDNIKDISLSKDNSSFPQAESDDIGSDDPEPEQGTSEAEDQIEEIEGEVIGLPIAGSQQQAHIKSVDVSAVQILMEEWNKMAAACNDKHQTKLAQAQFATADRLKKLPRVMRSVGLDVSQMIRLIQTIPESTFLTGRDTGFKAGFDFLLTEKHIIKIIEGQYHGTKRNDDNWNIKKWIAEGQSGSEDQTNSRWTYRG